MSGRLVVDWIACEGKGLCAELVPEAIERDEWGFPIVTAPGTSRDLGDQIRRAVRECPTMALRIVES
jgi:ferredoxin